MTLKPTPILSLIGIKRSFPLPGKEPRKLQVLEDLSLEIRAGEFVCLLGPSGCGKSTLLKIAASLDDDYRGKVLFQGREIRRPGPERLLIFQGTHQIYPWLTTLGNVLFSLRNLDSERKPKSRYGQEAVAILRSVGLSHALDLYPHQLSGGMRQRVALARALAVNPSILLMDEPFSNLDRDIRHRLRQLILDLRNERGCTILFVTHDVEEALVLADRVLCMDRQGRIIHSRTIVDPHPRDTHGPAFRARLREYENRLAESYQFKA